MADYFGIPPDKLHVVPLGIDTRDFAEAHARQHAVAAADNTRPPTIGYLARLAPEKGLHVLVEAFLQLRRMPGMDHVQLRIAGWLGENHRLYAESQFDKLREAGLHDAFQYVGEVDRQGKRGFCGRSMSCRCPRRTASRRACSCWNRSRPASR